MNVDVKIASKAIARRLEIILPELIHHNQNGFVKGRSVFDAVRTIDDLLELAQITNKSGILVAIDFEKAFDSLDHTFLLEVLEKLNFGTYFLQWIKTFYTDVSSCVLNNGFTTDLFQVRRGVRQGDQLSPLLFLLAIEILANTLAFGSTTIKRNSSQLVLLNSLNTTLSIMYEHQLRY